MQGYPTNARLPPKPPQPPWKTWAMIGGAVMAGCIGLVILSAILPKPQPKPETTEPAPPPRPQRPTVAQQVASAARSAGPQGTPAPAHDPGVFRTKSGYLAAATKEKLEKAIDLLANDPPAFEAMMASDRSVFPLQAGMEVVAVDADGILSGVAKMRKKGTTTEFWTVREALED